jgi:dimethylargininase
VTADARRPRGAIVALVRPPTAALARCELTHIPREPIDTARALAQHGRYVSALRGLGATVVTLPPLPDAPDAVFVEDLAIVLDEIAVITRPGALSRRAEADSIEAALAPYRPVARMAPPATLDGGDVIVVDRTLFVGLSTRSNAEGIEQLGRLLSSHGYQVRGVPVHGALHLKSAATYLGGGTLLANPDWVDPGAFGARRVIEVDRGEPRAANTFRVGDALVMADGFPKTVGLLERAGFAPTLVDLSELQKAEAAGSCMSLVFRGGSAASGGRE